MTTSALQDPPTHHFSYESMGTGWAVSVWDDLDPTVFSGMKKYILDATTAFDATYSRFKKDSLIHRLKDVRGRTEVPADLVEMLRLYETLGALSGGALNPLVGYALSDLGYDEEYSLREKSVIRSVPPFPGVLRILGDTHIELNDAVLIDLGALGKGYFVDRIAQYLKKQGVRRFLVNGSGDIRYEGDGIPLRAGLEHPDDPSKIIGVLGLFSGALCASASNRRRWGTHHHTIRPDTLKSPEDIIATWVKADTAALADGLCTCLFLTEPERYSSLRFDYCVMNPECKIKRSAGFSAELF